MADEDKKLDELKKEYLEAIDSGETGAKAIKPYRSMIARWLVNTDDESARIQYMGRMNTLDARLSGKTLSVEDDAEGAEFDDLSAKLQRGKPDGSAPF